MWHGVIVLDKPRGRSSHDMVAFCRRVLGQKRIGHTGTLDPLATGVLPLCLGEATRLAEYLSGQDKVYEAEILPGYKSKTYDSEGELQQVTPSFSCSEAELRKVLQQFCGEISQKPPPYSAISVDGRRLYQYARSGEQVIVPERKVTIYSLHLSEEITSVQAGEPFTLQVCCSKGTYIRSLAHDLGQVLGCGAVLSGLRRLRSGNISIENACTREEIIACQEGNCIETLLWPLRPDDLGLPWVRLSEVQQEEMRFGRSFAWEQPVISAKSDMPTKILLCTSAELLAIGDYQPDKGIIHPRKVFNSPVPLDLS